MSDIKLLTYNIWWYCMTGKGNKAGSGCIDGIAETIENNGPYDFINLQEASNDIKLQADAPLLKSMGRKHAKGGAEHITTYYDKNKYTLHTTGVYSGDLDGGGHPYLFLAFKEGIVLLNVHPGHVGWTNAHSQIENAMAKHGLENKYPGYRYIMSGDFNTNISFTYVTFGSIKMYVGKQLKTCCIPASNSGAPVTQSGLADYSPYSYYFDHVLDSAAPPVETEIPDIVRPASDHAPILATLVPLPPHSSPSPSPHSSVSPPPLPPMSPSGTSYNELFKYSLISGGILLILVVIIIILIKG